VGFLSPLPEDKVFLRLTRFGGRGLNTQTEGYSGPPRAGNSSVMSHPPLSTDGALAGTPFVLADWHVEADTVWGQPVGL
jgi:hypothetical protein